METAGDEFDEPLIDTDLSKREMRQKQDLAGGGGAARKLKVES
jgi:hypothetical protein